MSQSLPRHSLFDDVQGLLTGTLLVALGLVMIKHSGLMTGGAVGLAFLIHYATGANFGLLLVAVNLPFYWLALRKFGKDFTLKTFAAVALVAVLTETLPTLMRFSQLQPAFAAVAGGLLMGVGMLILFRHRASLGGFNVLVLYLQERFGWRAGATQMGLDVAILTAALPFVPPMLIALSVLGAVVLNLALAVNHRPGRYAAY